MVRIRQSYEKLTTTIISSVTTRHGNAHRKIIHLLSEAETAQSIKRALIATEPQGLTLNTGLLRDAARQH